MSNTIHHPYTSAVILAAGSGTRAGSNLPKQFVMIDGIPVVIRTLTAFNKCDYVDEIVIVCSKDNEYFLNQSLKEQHFEKAVKVVAGGNSRAESAQNGVKGVSDRTEFVAIHDAVRCNISPIQISQVIFEAYQYNAAIAAIRITDTIKKIDSDGFIIETLDRSNIWRAQTPQVFSKKLYMDALENYKKLDLEITDDASLIEKIYGKIKVVECSEENIKITYPDDFDKVRRLLI